MTYERLLVRLQRRERRALEDLYDATASRLYACLYHDLPDEQQCEYVLGLLYEHVWTYPQAYCTEALFDQLLTCGRRFIQDQHLNFTMRGTPTV
ncbi:hypothetical protein [uncultured Marinococcus sp.]|jgi:hypothetical protein|uniref:hypothetical protein n=1 Tax=uncultured Marinococcus sp. TaxID=487012 RepID=UPI00263774CD|nr:hypothetical protein [uncultured Marinococcus sp.]